MQRRAPLVITIVGGDGNGAVGRVEGEVGTHLRWEEVVDTSVEKISDYKMTITTIGKDRSVPCSFGPDEGADRFLRMVEAESGLQSDDG